jgi:hypothetical protein
MPHFVVSKAKINRVTMIPSLLICREINLMKASVCQEIEFMGMNESSLCLGFSCDEILILKNLYVCGGLVQNRTRWRGLRKGPMVFF